ncbi:transmembrane protein 154 [Puntigrus tetrazona]|uniref:transmembrane protein 154 n=1 Tax=Puntigrus tetrazona TaxID=1606681 RepID=UPI001C8A021D|nr:transmembrane protein 154 [Puntigrus tetrazona]
MNLILFLLLALTASWTELVQCEDNEEIEEDSLIVETHKAEGEEKDSENQGDGAGSGDGRSQDLDSPPYSDTNIDQTVTNEEANSTAEANTDTEAEDLNLVMIIIPLALTLVVIAVVMCVVVIYRRWRIKVAEHTKEDPYLDQGDHEKVPMPMFDDDIPSVMELEMEDLENWMVKDGGKKVDTGQI